MITSLQLFFLTLPIYYKPKNAQWPDVHSVHEINPDTHFLCEMNITVKLYWASCGIYDVDSHFFANKNNLCSYKMLTSAKLHKKIGLEEIMLGYLRYIEMRNLREFGVNLISNIFCAVAWNFLCTQKFEQEIWHKKKGRKIVLSWKRCPLLLAPFSH